MATPKLTLWRIDPHTLAKHEILRRYLGAWFPILGSSNPRIVYIDGFCGPGRYEGGEPGSPVIAVHEAMRHLDRLRHNKLTFLFMDERSDRIEHLQHELNQLGAPPNFTLSALTGQFESQFRSLLENIDRQNLKLAPTFAFIDPFGFQGLPFDLVCKLLKNQKTEVLINVMVDPINRFLEHPNESIQRHFIDLFGTARVLHVARSPGDRVENLRLLYQEQLLSCARFVRFFEMRNSNDRRIYYLFFATNHPLGHVKMKHAFWRVDPSSGYRFSDATDPHQLVLFELDESSKLADMLLQKFAGQAKVLTSNILRFVEDKTPFIEKHMKSALTILEKDHCISVEENKTDGKKRRKATFPEGTIVNFF